MTQALRAFIDGEIIYAITSSREATASRVGVRGYKQDPETFDTQTVTLTGRTLARVRETGRECGLWETPAWCDPEVST